MSGLWSDYQEDERTIASQKFYSDRGTTRQQETFSTSVINLQDDDVDNQPIFKRENLIFKETASIVKIVTANNVLIIGLLSNKVKRYYVGTPELDDTLEIPCPVGSIKIHNLYVDPTGKHCLISMTSGEIFYGFTGKNKLKSLVKLNCNTIESVAWNQTKQSDVDTKEILIGNSCGTIYETKLNPSSDKQLIAYSKLLHNLEDGEAVTGLVFFHENGDPSQRTVVIVATQTRLYQFFGKLNFSDQSKFNDIFNSGELPQFKQNVEAFGFMRVFYKKYPEPRSLIWMAGSGVQYYKVDISTTGFNDSCVLSENKQIDVTENRIPLDIGLSEFHLLLLYDIGFEARSLINFKHVHLEPLKSAAGNFAALAMDPINQNKFFSHAKQNLVKFKIHKEDRNVWRLYMHLRKFQEAEFYANGDQAKLFEIASEEGDFYFEKGMYDESANCYASSNRSFEEIALKFIKDGTSNALMNFLKTKLGSLGTNSSPTQICMLVVWIVEIYLSKISDLERQPNPMDTLVDELNNYRADFRHFLSDETVVRNIKKNIPIIKVIQEMMASYGDTSDMIYFADLMEDIEKVIMHHIHDQQYVAALETLRKKRNPDLFYKYTPTLMKYIPSNTVDVLERFDGILKPQKLLPSFIHCKTSEQKEHVLRYLRTVVSRNKCRDEAIHNFLMSLYVQQDDETALLDFLLMEDARFDLKYALRLCSEHRKWHACCYIYTKMRLYEEAVKLALSKLNNVTEAVKTAHQAQISCPDDQEMIKKLWLRIARHVVEKEEDIKLAMDFINRVDQVLKIEDILPFFKDFFYIDDFKEAICKSLEIYSQNINQLNDDMKEATESAEKIHKDIGNLKRKHCVVEASKKCYFCELPLLMRSFYVFPCTHMYHTNCLVQEITQSQYLSKRKSEEVEKVYKTLLTLKDDEQTRTERYRNAKLQLDDIIAEECLMCGEYMIQSIDKPFLTIDFEEYEVLKSEWA